MIDVTIEIMQQSVLLLLKSVSCLKTQKSDDCHFYMLISSDLTHTLVGDVELLFLFILIF